MNHDNLDNARKEGYSAYQDGKTLNDNPYETSLEEWVQWNEGWYDAAWDD